MLIFGFWLSFDILDYFYNFLGLNSINSFETKEKNHNKNLLGCLGFRKKNFFLVDIRKWRLSVVVCRRIVKWKNEIFDCLFHSFDVEWMKWKQKCKKKAREILLFNTISLDSKYLYGVFLSRLVVYKWICFWMSASIIIFFFLSFFSVCFKFFSFLLEIQNTPLE